MVYADRMRKVLTGRTADWLGRNSHPRLVVLFAYSVAMFVAYQASVVLLACGVLNMPLRFSICFLVAYGTYVATISIWIWRTPTLDRQTLLFGAPREIETTSPADASDEWLPHVEAAFRQSIARDGKNVAGVLIAIAILGLIFLLSHSIWFARWHLGELLVMAGKVRHGSLSRRIPDSVLVAPLRQTIWMGIGLLAHFMLIGMLLELKHVV